MLDRLDKKLLRYVAGGCLAGWSGLGILAFIIALASMGDVSSYYDIGDVLGWYYFLPYLGCAAAGVCTILNMDKYSLLGFGAAAFGSFIMYIDLTVTFAKLSYYSFLLFLMLHFMMYVWLFLGAAFIFRKHAARISCIGGTICSGALALGTIIGSIKLLSYIKSYFSYYSYYSYSVSIPFSVYFLLFLCCVQFIALAVGTFAYGLLMQEGPIDLNPADMLNDAKKLPCLKSIRSYFASLLDFPAPVRTAAPARPAPERPAVNDYTATVRVKPAPAEYAPVEPAPANPAPAESAPVEPAPVKPEPEEYAPAEPAPVEAAPAEYAPAEPAPVESAPAEAAPTLNEAQLKNMRILQDLLDRGMITREVYDKRVKIVLSETQPE